MVKVLFRRPCHVPPCLINGEGGSIIKGYTLLMVILIVELYFSLFDLCIWALLFGVLDRSYISPRQQL